MVQAKELRIGNWVDGGVYYRIKNSDFIYTDFTKTNPIPLTPEILEKAWFVTPEHYQKTVLYKDGVMIDFHRGVYKLRDNARIVIRCLHQLQNLYFALTEQELEINL